MNIEKLRDLFEKSPDKYGDAKKMNTTYQTMYNLIYKGSICKVDLLERIAAFYNVPVGYFFDEVLISVTASGTQSIVTNSGNVSVRSRTDGDNIGTQNKYGETCANGELSSIVATLTESVVTLTESVVTLTRELETSQEQKSKLIEIIDKLTNK